MAIELKFGLVGFSVVAVVRIFSGNNWLVDSVVWVILGMSVVVPIWIWVCGCFYLFQFGY